MGAKALAEVEDRVRVVARAHGDAIKSVTGAVYSSTAEKHAQGALRGLSGAIEDWANRGRAAARADKAPEGKGWPGWLRAGEAFRDGFPEIAKQGTVDYTLADMAAALREAPATANAAVDATIGYVGSKTKKVARAAGGGLWELAKPLLVPGALVVAGLYFWSRR